MKYSEFQRWLIANGAIVDKTHGKGSHRTVYFKGRSTTFPFHRSKEIGESLRKKILKDLNMQ